MSALSPGPELESWLRVRVGEGHALTPLHGDASTRLFLRAARTHGPSFILMLLGRPFLSEELPWLIANALFLELGLPVPRVIEADGAAGVLLVEDLGDRLLQDAVRGPAAASPARLERLYDEALDILVVLREKGTPRAGELATAATALDEDLFRWEMGFFREHYLRGVLGLEEGSAADRALQPDLERIAAEAAAAPLVLCHRDYHSRNLLVRGDRLALIDHQDARLGPDLYDLASLLRDPYADLDEAFEERALERFLAAAGLSAGEPDEARSRYERVALQRDLKALGTYGHQAAARGKGFYLEYAPRAASLARRALDLLPGYGGLVRVLEDLSFFEAPVPDPSPGTGGID